MRRSMRKVKIKSQRPKVTLSRRKGLNSLYELVEGFKKSIEALVVAHEKLKVDFG
jgi:hypothetical protein